MKKISYCLLAMVLFTTGVSAQVTIGSGKVPESFSALELISQNERGLRLPQLTTAERDAVETSGEFQAEKTREAMGLQIFNLSTRCVETWNGTVWITQCPPEGPVLPPLPPAPPVSIGVASNCVITPRNGNNTVYTAKTDPNAAAYEFFVGGVSQGTQSSNVLTLPSATAFSQVTVQYLYPPAFLKPTMIAVQGGTFMYQSRTQDSTNPVATGGISAGSSVALSDFFMSETLVTQAQFEAVMGINPSWHQCGASGEIHVATRPTSALPVENVSWYDAITYCNKLSLLEGKTPVYHVSGVDFATFTYNDFDDIFIFTAWNAVTQNLSANGYRLPTEAEWEYAARGGQQSERISGRATYDFYYAGSNNADEVAWYRDNNGSSGSPVKPYYATKPVKEKKANVLGLYDMSGNVQEWCWDWWDDYVIVSGSNPVGPVSGFDRVLRGGDYLVAGSTQVTSRNGTDPGEYLRGASNIGFRVICR